VDAAPLLDALARAGRTLAVAESFTGGLLLDTLTHVPGASAVLRGGLVAYADDAKVRLLGVPRGVLATHGAVSEATARAMAAGVRDLFEADYGVATTGIAGPGGATPLKPLGLSHVAAASRGELHADATTHRGDRQHVKAAAVAQALVILGRLLDAEGIL
jgi:PncC family amidohydrolase